MNVCMYMWNKVPVDARGIRSPKSGVLGSCELPSVCARGKTQIFYNISMCCLLSTHLSGTCSVSVGKLFF